MMLISSNLMTVNVIIVLVNQPQLPQLLQVDKYIDIHTGCLLIFRKAVSYFQKPFYNSKLNLYLHFWVMYNS